MQNNILTALGKLDANNDNHWTSDGLPRLDTVKMLAADQSISRDDVTKAAPGFSRTQPLQALQGAGSDAGTTPVLNSAPASATQATATETAPTVAAIGVANGQAEDEVGEDEVSALEKELAIAQERLEEIQRVEVQFLQEKAARVAEVNRLTDALTAIVGTESTMDTIQSYLAGQKRLLEQRANQIERIRKADINLKDLIPSIAPIDAAMARKTGRGATRPKR